MWMVVYVRPPRPHVSVINHCPHRLAAGFMLREIGSFKTPSDQSGCVWMCVRECQTKTVCWSPGGFPLCHVSVKTFNNMQVALWLKLWSTKHILCERFVLTGVISTDWILLGKSNNLHMNNIIISYLLCVNRWFKWLLYPVYKNMFFT